MRSRGGAPAWLPVLLLGLLGLAAACGSPMAPAPAASGAAPPAAAAAAASAGAVPPSRQPVRVATCAVSGGFLHLYTALEADLFARHGLDVEHVTIRGSSQALAALTANELQFLYCAADATIAGLASGAEAKLVAAPLVGPPFVFITRPDIRTFADLRGKSVGVPRVGDLADKLTRQALLRHSLAPNEEVEIRPVGGSQPERYQALLADIVQGIVIAPPLDAQARKDGLNVLYDLADLDVPFVYSAVHATNATIRERPELVERFVAAMAETMRFTEQNPAVAREALRKVLAMDDPDVLDAAYTAYARKLANPRLRIPFDAVQEAIADARASGTNVTVRSADDIATNAFVDHLEQQGLFHRLYPTP